MNRAKFRITALIALIALFFIAMGFAVASAVPAKKAGAVTYAPTSVFSQGSGGDVVAYKASSADDAKAYVAFSMSDGGAVYYRRDLALKWFSAAAEPDPDRANPGEVHYFSLTFSFPKVNFESFEIAFESAEENVGKDGKSVNTVRFATEGDALSVELRDAYYDEDVPSTHPVSHTVAAPTADMTLTLAETYEDGGEKTCAAGQFAVTLTAGEEEIALGFFENVGGYFLEYRSSAATTPSVPMTFKAELPEGATQKVLLKSLNGQSLETTGGSPRTKESGETDVEDDGTVAMVTSTVDSTAPRVTDDAAPVLVLNEKVYSFRLGQRFSLTYEAIDVCDDSVSVSRSFYMLKQTDGKYVKPNEETDDDYAMLSTSTYFMPADESGEADAEGNVKAYVSIRFSLDDGRGGDAERIYLTWYADPEAEVVETLGEGDDRFDYILVDRKAVGPSYLGVTPVEAFEETAAHNEVSPEAQEAREAYAKLVEDSAAGVSAGDGAYFYLPSLRGIIGSKYADYRNLRFNIYYYKPGQTAGSSASSATSLRYNTLRFEVDKVGEYVFRVVASDAAGRGMELYHEGELVTVDSDNVWLIDGIPEFRFEVGYTGPRIEEVGEQTEGYRNQSYTISDFDIIALAGYETQYSLYRLVPSEGESFTYSDIVDAAKDGATFETQYGEKLETISEYRDDVAETDEEWSHTDNDYRWDPESSLSFVPQKTGIYLVKVVVTDSAFGLYTETAYQAINVRNPIDTTPGRSLWLQNNVTAIVLFSISAVLLVAIIILFVVKPSDSKVEEVDLSKLKGKKTPKGKK